VSLASVQEDFSVEEQVRQLMADVLNLDPNAIDGSTSQDSTSSWDSLSHINLIVALEQEFQVSFDVSEIESMLSYSDILETVEKKLHS
jgi:acyl carrier protein